MDLKERVLAGALSGFLATFVLSGLRISLKKLGLVYTTAPEQVVRRLEEFGPLKGWPLRARQALMVAAHFAYGTGAGASFGALRTEGREPQSEEVEELRGKREGPVTEAAVGATLGVLSWGAGWAGWLPLAGVHPAPWTQKTPRALLPVLDHAAYGAAWGLVYWVLTRRHA
jgi:hypothetical protein